MKHIFETLQKRLRDQYPKGLYIRQYPDADAFAHKSLSELLILIMKNQVKAYQDGANDTINAVTHTEQHSDRLGCYRSIQDLYCIVQFYKPVSFEEFIVTLIRMELDGKCTTYRCQEIDRWCATPNGSFTLVREYDGYLNRYSEFDKEFGMNLPEELHRYVASLPKENVPA